jgi:hypothetical protein
VSVFLFDRAVNRVVDWTCLLWQPSINSLKGHNTMRKSCSLSRNGRGRTKQVWSVNYKLKQVTFRRGVRFVKFVDKQVVARGGAQLKKSMTTLSRNREVLSWTLDRIRI